MNFLNKIEDLINNLLVRLQEIFWAMLQRATPARVKGWIEKYREKKALFIAWLKTLPALIKDKTQKKIATLKTEIAGIDIKGKIKASYQRALARSQTDEKEVRGKFSKLKKMLLAPFLVVGEWLQGLSTAQSLMLLTFSAASVLAAVTISFEGRRLLNHMEASRAPASVEVEEEYARPNYYKKQTRHVDFTGVRLPVYVPEINELRTVDIDFTITLSNRESKLWLEKREFQFRDHLIINMEPLTAAFPLEDEGKEIIRQKLISEVNQYLIENKIEAHVVELKLTYVLAN